MKLKKVILDILVIAAAFALFVIWYNHNEKDSSLTAASLKQNYNIYLITKDKQIQFWNYINQGVSDMAALLGLTYRWEAPEVPDTDKQIELVNSAVASGADAIIIAINDPDRLSAPIKAAKDKGVKIIYVDTPANEEAIVTLETNNYDAGRIAAENMIEELELGGITSGEIGIFGIDTVTPTTLQREEGFRDKITADKRFTLLSTVYTGGDQEAAQKEAEDMIKEHKALVGLFAANEINSVGVGNAIKEDKNRIVGIGFDKSDVTLELLRSESLKAIVVQNPYTMGYLGMAEAYAALKGFDTGPRNVDTGVSVLRKR